MKLLLLALALSIPAACTALSPPNEEDDFRAPLVCEPKFERLPCGRGVAQGVAYCFSLLTHCGVEWAYLDGRYWLPSPKIDTPSNWGNITVGTITLIDGDEAVFEGEPGGEVRFRPASARYRPVPCV